MITLGLDMSTNKSGYAIFNDKTLIEWGVWDAPTELKGYDKWRQRIVWMAEQLNNLIQTHNIEQVYCEDVIFVNNAKTLQMLGALQGMVLSVCTVHNIKIEFVPISTWRKIIGIQENKKVREEYKKSSIDYANKTFGLNLIYVSPDSKKNQDDIADAINIGWSRILSPKTIGRR